jgi:hypothetical protein
MTVKHRMKYASNDIKNKGRKEGLIQYCNVEEFYHHMHLMYGATLPCITVEGYHGSVYEYFHDSELSQNVNSYLKTEHT